MNILFQKLSKAILFAALSLVVLVFFLISPNIASAAGVIPDIDLITSYFSTGGTVQYKDSVQDNVYKIQQGDTITFNIIPNPAYPNTSYFWRVMKQGGLVIFSFNAGTVFDWTVPSETSTWDIEIEATLKDGGDNFIGKETVNWSITTSDLKTINPGESIQTVIDSLALEGGIIELVAGTWNITSPIWINKNNVTIIGSRGIDETIINQTTSQNDGIILSTFYDYKSRDAWLYKNNIKWDVMIKWFIDHPEEVIKNVTIQDLSVFTYGPGPIKYTAISAVEAQNIIVKRVRIKGDADITKSNAPRGVFFSHFIDASVNDSIFDTIGEPLTMHTSFRGNAINNTIPFGIQFSAIQFNGVPGYKGIDSQIKNNKITGIPGSTGVIYVYSSRDVTIQNNIVNISKNNDYAGAIMVQIPTGRIDVLSNILTYNCRTICLNSGGIYIKSQYNYIIYGNISNNLIINSNTNGISINDHYGRLDWNNYNISNNVIFGNNGSGIYNPLGIHISSLRNNIITDNKGYGINNIANNSYNNVYNNILGNYNITLAGIGDISLDPLFADPANGDFHLKSQAGRWNSAAWITDSVTSPAIGAGDPATVIANCPSWGCPSRIEMGAYGNTTEASQSFIAPTPTSTPTLTPTPTSSLTPTPAPKLSADLNSDGKVNSQDFAILMSAWNSTDKPKADINQDGLVDSLDFGLMMSFWG